MSLPCRFRVGIAYSLLLAVGVLSTAAAEKNSDAAASVLQAPGLGDPGSLLRLKLENGRLVDARFELVGRDAQQQLVVAGEYSTGQTRDLSREVSYATHPAGIVTISSDGLVEPKSEGTAKITITHELGPSVEVSTTVLRLKDELPINFPNQIVPLFSKLGCNTGGCHGKTDGKNGFRLSLFGNEPEKDYDYIVKEGRGRRLLPSSPERSLLLLKATAKVPHGGGAKLEKDSYNYRILHRWIQQGMPYGSDADPVVQRIEVFPQARSMQRGSDQQISVTAYYSDGTSCDVTRIAQFDVNDAAMAEVSASGLVSAGDLTGDVAVMVRFQSRVSVFRATIPLGLPVDNLPPANNKIDQIVFHKLTTLGLPPSDLCDDSTFIRRVSIDITGRLPRHEDTARFLADRSPDKRARLIDRLLESSGYAEYFANKWSSILRNKRVTDAEKRGTFAFHSWIRQSLHENKPYDQFVRDIVAASGEMGVNPPVTWYREVKAPIQQVEDTTQLFLGTRLQCARCHHHPYEKWSEQDYYGLSAFFSTIGRKPGLQFREERIFHKRAEAVAKNPKTGENVKPTGLGASPLELSPEDDPRHALVDWMTAKDNPFFAPALVNRYWKHFFSRGLVEPEDDMRATNPASNPELLQALSKGFIESRFDLKELVRTICNSTTYQLNSLPNAYNADDRQNYSHYYPKRLTAEVLLDAVDRVTGVPTPFEGAPNGTRALELPDNNFSSYFLEVFGRPEGSMACECERTNEPSLAQSLHLLNSIGLQNKVSSESGRAHRLAQDPDRSHQEKIRLLYLAAFSRAPTAQEMSLALGHLQTAHNDPAKTTQAYEDLVWILVNTKSFRFNR